LYFSPFAAMNSASACGRDQPNAPGGAEADVIDRGMTRMLGAPFGGRCCAIGGNLVSGSFASIRDQSRAAASGIGRAVRALFLVGHR
jgi:hypothetical protein